MGVKVRLEGAETLNQRKQCAQTTPMRTENACRETEQKDGVLTGAGGVKEDLGGSEKPLPVRMP